MSFQDLAFRRVITAVLTVWGLAILALFVTGCVLAPLLPASMADALESYLNVVSDASSTPAEIEAERDALWADYSSPITVQYLLQWSAVALATFWVARRTGRFATSPEQASGYGAAIGAGVALTYGTLCGCLPSIALAAPALLGLMALFMGIFVAAGFFGARQATPEKAKAIPIAGAGPLPGFGGLPGLGDLPRASAVQDATRAETYYQMGVQAALGGRRDEARQHFTQVLQLQPRSVPAWLQLANLAETPEQAWNYVQQARAINPNDPAVRDAVAIIWPQVAQHAERYEPPRNQPPYAGAQSDDSAVPRIWMPDLTPPDAIAPPAAPAAPEQPPAEPDSDDGPPSASPSA